MLAKVAAGELFTVWKPSLGVRTLQAAILRIAYTTPGSLDYVVLTPEIDDFAVSVLGVFWSQNGQVRALPIP